MKITIKTNIKDISKKMAKNPTKVQFALRNTIKKTAFLIERNAKMRSPVDTGRLRSSIRSSILPFTATVKPTVNYATFVHEGTRFMRARPFMRQGARDSKSQIQDIFTNEVKRALR